MFYECACEMTDGSLWWSLSEKWLSTRQTRHTRLAHDVPRSDHAKATRRRKRARERNGHGDCSRLEWTQGGDDLGLNLAEVTSIVSTAPQQRRPKAFGDGPKG